MATAFLLGWMAWALPVQLVGTCLRCWPDAVLYFDYDANLLLKQESDIADKLERLFLGTAEELAKEGRKYLEREHMEHEAGNLFARLEKIVRNSGKDYDRLMQEAMQEKKIFVKQLEEASKNFLKEVCSFSCAHSRFKPYEVAQCVNCKLLKVSCFDPFVCAGVNVAAAVLVPLVILIGIGVFAWYYHKKKTKGSKTPEEGSKENSESSEGSESSESTEESQEAEPSPPKKNKSKSKQKTPPTPPEYGVPSPPPSEIPSPPPFEFPSPPSFEIPSPPPF